MSGIFVLIFLCALELFGAHIALKASPKSLKEYYNKNDPFQMLFRQKNTNSAF
ncbi:hypothetical protein B1no1_14540 [Thermolongibacillus altinsuensis]|jgi:hypothetical protein|nr:hypothetical protein B1no1_14540 [Thermolongibacillus altinsuensis]